MVPALKIAVKDDRVYKGKRKIEIKRIEEQGKRQVTFSKRRAGFFKKAGELSLLCGAHMAVVVQSPAGNFFTFGHPDADLLIHRYLTGSSRSAAAGTLDDIVHHHHHHHQLESVNRRCSELCKELDAEKMKKKAAINDGYSAACESAANLDLERIFWWEEDEEGFDDDEKEIEEYILALQDLKSNILSRAEDLSLLSMAKPSPSCSVPVSSSEDVDLLQETLAEVDDNNYDSNDNAAVADEEEEEWMNRVMAMMEEEGGDYNVLQDDELLCGIASSGDVFLEIRGR